MANIKQWLETAIVKYGEPLEAVVVGRHYNRRYDDDYNDALPLNDENVILAPSIALAKLDEDFDAGFGGADCFPIYAWTASRVFWIAEYDGATSLVWCPRNPTPIKPEFSGQDAEYD